MELKLLKHFIDWNNLLVEKNGRWIKFDFSKYIDSFNKVNPNDKIFRAIRNIYLGLINLGWNRKLKVIETEEGFNYVPFNLNPEQKDFLEKSIEAYRKKIYGKMQSPVA